MRASLENFEILPFSHSKTAVSFNIFVGTSDTLSQKHIQFQVSNNIYGIHIHVQSMQFPCITYGIWCYIINDSIPTNTNIEQMYVYASERA